MGKSDSTILHFIGTRLTIFGTGNLDLVMRSKQGVRAYEMSPLAMSTATDIEPMVLANIRQQRAQVEFSTDVMGEKFTISKIVVYSKPTASGYPQ